MTYKNCEIKRVSTRYLLSLFFAVFPFIANGDMSLSSLPASPSISPFVQSQATPMKQGSLEVITPIDVQLRALREKNIRKAYDETASEEFKKTTSLEEFTKYVKLYPVLMNHEQISIKTQTEQGNQANVSAILDQDRSNVNVQYSLNKEKGEWKIWKMEIVTGYTPSVNELIKDPYTLNKPVEEFFALLKEGNLPKAYYGYTSKEFQVETPLDAFRKFFTDYKALLDYESLSLEHPVIDNGTGKLEAVLHGDNIETYLDITLGITDNQWKIWAISVLKQQPRESLKAEEPMSSGASSDSQTMHSDFLNMPATAGSLQFAKIELGNKIGANGAIIDPQSSLSALHEYIYVELYIINGQQGDKIDVHLKHYDTQSELPSISTTLQQNGNSVVSFSFSPPAIGWPKGTYQLQAESATGTKKTFTFILS